MTRAIPPGCDGTRECSAPLHAIGCYACPDDPEDV